MDALIKSYGSDSESDYEDGDLALAEKLKRVRAKKLLSNTANSRASCSESVHPQLQVRGKYVPADITDNSQHHNLKSFIHQEHYSVTARTGVEDSNKQGNTSKMQHYDPTMTSNKIRPGVNNSPYLALPQSADVVQCEQGVPFLQTQIRSASLRHNSVVPRQSAQSLADNGYASVSVQQQQSSSTTRQSFVTQLPLSRAQTGVAVSTLPVPNIKHTEPGTIHSVESSLHNTLITPKQHGIGVLPSVRPPFQHHVQASTIVAAGTNESPQTARRISHPSHLLPETSKSIGAMNTAVSHSQSLNMNDTSPGAYSVPHHQEPSLLAQHSSPVLLAGAKIDPGASLTEHALVTESNVIPMKQHIPEQLSVGQKLSSNLKQILKNTLPVHVSENDMAEILQLTASIQKTREALAKPTPASLSSQKRDFFNSFDLSSDKPLEPSLQGSDSPLIRPYQSKKQRLQSSTISPVIPACESQESIRVPYPEIKRLSCESYITSSLPHKIAARFTNHTKAALVHWCSKSDLSHLLASASMDGTVKLWDVCKKKCVRSFEKHRNAVKEVRWSSDACKILTGSLDLTARVTDTETGQEIQNLRHSTFVWNVQYHVNDDNLFLTSVPDKIFAWDLRVNVDSGPIRSFREQFGNVQDMEFLRDGKEFVSSGDLVSRSSSITQIMAWDFASGAALSNQIFKEPHVVTCLRRHPHDAFFLAQTHADYMALFSSQRPYKMNKERLFKGHKVSGYHVKCDFSPHGTFIVSGSSDGKVFFYSYKTGLVIRSLVVSENDPCIGVSFHPVLPSTVATSNWSGVITIWE